MRPRAPRAPPAPLRRAAPRGRNSSLPRGRPPAARAALPRSPQSRDRHRNEQDGQEVQQPVRAPQLQAGRKRAIEADRPRSSSPRCQRSAERGDRDHQPAHRRLDEPRARARRTHNPHRQARPVRRLPLREKKMRRALQDRRQPGRIKRIASVPAMRQRTPRPGRRAAASTRAAGAAPPHARERSRQFQALRPGDAATVAAASATSARSGRAASVQASAATTRGSASVRAVANGSAMRKVADAAVVARDDRKQRQATTSGPVPAVMRNTSAAAAAKNASCPAMVTTIAAVPAPKRSISGA